MGVHGHPVAASEAPLGTIHDGITETNTSLDTLNATQTDALTTLGALQTLLGGTGSLGLTSAAVTALQNAFTTSLATNHTDLTTIASDLADIHAELITKFESGDLVGMSQATLDGIGTAIATLFHYPTDYPSAGANTKLDTVHTDLGHLTDNTQTTKITNGINTTDVVAVNTGWNALVNIPAVLKTSYSAISATAAAVDALGYSAVVVAVTADSGTWAIQGSSDNSSFTNLPVGTVNNTGPVAISTGNTVTSTGLYVAYTYGYRYIRLSRTSGTLTADMTLYTRPPFEIGYSQSNGLLSVGQSGTWTVQPGSTQNFTLWAVGGLAPTTSLNAVTATGAGTAVNLGGMSKTQTLQVTIGGTGALSALTVLLEGSLDGANWVTLATNTATALGTTTTYSVNQPVSRIRANCTVRTASSGTPTITAIVGAAT